MAKKTTLNELGAMVELIIKNMATKDDIAEVRKEMATKDQLFALQTQVNSIESDIRDMKHFKLEFRVADLEEKVFGKAHS